MGFSFVSLALFSYIIWAALILLVVYLILAMIKTMFFNPWLQSKERMFQKRLELMEKERTSQQS